MTFVSRSMAGALALSLLMSSSVLAQNTERHVFVTVLDQDGTPVSGLGAEHFAVREDGRDRKILRVAPLDTPMHVAVLVDMNFHPSLPIDAFRSALGEFLERLAGFHHVALYTVAERPARVVPFTRNVADLRMAAGKLFARPDTRTYLIDTVDLALGDMRPLEPARPVIVAFTTENFEASNLTAAAVMKQMIGRFTSFHAITFATRTGNVVATPMGRDPGNKDVPARSQQLGRLNAEGESDRERNRLLDEGTRLTAGSVQTVVNLTTLNAPFFKLASEFAYSYRVTFAGPPAEKLLKGLQIGLLVEGVTVRAIAAPDMAMQAR